MKRNYPSIIITPEGEKWLDKGQMWMYKNNLGSLDDSIENGSLVDIMTTQGRYLGTGFLSKESHITVRILTKNQNEVIDREFFKKKIQFAYDFRKTVEKDNLTNCRLVFGEADGLPGLTADRYNEIIVTQITSYGLDLIKDMIYELLLEVLKEDGQNVSAIYERNDVKVRAKEGLELYKGFWKPSTLPTTTVINENGLKLNVDVENGQKTGYFLDQKSNRVLLRNMSAGKTVLDCFSHTGGFALNAAFGGAKYVTAVDVSQTALDQGLANAKMNHLEERMSFVQDDVFDYLDKCHQGQYDIIVLDPPAFTKSKETVKSAYKGYKKINKEALLNIKKGGYLLTFSCSGHMTMDLFFDMLKEAVSESKRRVQMIDFRIQSPDHPTLLDFNSLYLKCVILRVLE